MYDADDKDLPGQSLNGKDGAVLISQDATIGVTYQFMSFPYRRMRRRHFPQPIHCLE